MQEDVSALDDLIQAAQEAGTRIAAEAADGARVEVRRDADREIAEIRDAAARDADEQRTKLTGEIEDLQRRLDEMRADYTRQLEEFQGQLEASQQETAAERERVAAARAETENATRDLESARQELETTREDVEATLEEIERARRDSDAVRAELRQMSEAVRRTAEHAAQSARLPDAVRALDRAVSFREVLESLAQSAGREAGRAVVFLVKGERLCDWRTVGFHLASDQARLDIALSDSGPMAEAARSGDGVRLGVDHPLPDFARTDEAREGAAWPVSVGGSVVAVLYADSPVADKPDELYWPAFLEVLARHAGRVLEGLTVRQAAGLMTGQAGIRSSSSGHQSSGSLQ
jgi:hypothetical protein